MIKPIFLSYAQIIETLNSHGIETDKKQMQSIFSMFDIEDEKGNVGVKDNKLTNSELDKFLQYLKENYVDKFINAFSDITEKMSQNIDIENQEITSNDEFYSPKRTEQLHNKLIPEFKNLSEKQKNRVKELLYIEGRGDNQLGDETLLRIGQLSEEDYSKIKEFISVPGREPQYNLDEMMALSAIPKEKHHIFNNPERGNNQISPLIVSGDEDNENIYEIIERLSSIKVHIKDFRNNNNGERLLNNDEIGSIISVINGDNADKAITIMQDPTFSDCKINDIIKVVKLSDEQLENIKKILQNPPSSSKNIIDAALDLSALTQDELEVAQKYYNIPERGNQQLSGSGIALIAKLTEEERQFANDNGLIYSPSRKRQLTGTFISQIAKMKSDELRDFINKNPDFQFKPSVNEDIVILSDNNGVEYAFDKDGLVSQKELISEGSLPDGRRSNVYITKNYRLHTEQETTYVALEHENPTVYSIKTKYFDENNNLLKTLTLKENANNSYDASMSYANGKNIALQHSNYDEESGIGTIERNFVSPEGVKTNYYYEDSVDGSRIVDYTITDANGNVLLDEHNTFQQISDNEFLSTSNGKSYKVEIKDENLLIIDQETKKEHTVNIGSIIANPEQRDIVINYLKNIPASQLMFLEKQPITMLFDDYFSTADNGYYSYSDKQLALSHPFVDKDLNLFVLTHEWGHYIDLYLTGEKGTISSNTELDKIYQEELAQFLENTNSDEQSNMSYLMQEGVGASERVGDANALRYTGKGNMPGIRDFYYQQYFPRTIAKIVELVHSEEDRVAQ